MSIHLLLISAAVSVLVLVVVFVLVFVSAFPVVVAVAAALVGGSILPHLFLSCFVVICTVLVQAVVLLEFFGLFVIFLCRVRLTTLARVAFLSHG